MKYFETLLRKEPDCFEIGAPLVLQETAIIKDTVENKILLRNVFFNIASQPIVAISVKIFLADIFGQPALYDGRDSFEYVYQDIQFEPQEIFGNKISIDVPVATRKVTVEISKVLLLDGTIWESNIQNRVTLQEQKQIEISKDYLQSIDNNEISPDFYYEENNTCWQCTCGQANLLSDKECRRCGRQREKVKKYTPKLIQESFAEYEKQQEKIRSDEIEKQKDHDRELKREELEKLQIQKDDLQRELSTLKGLFKGGKRKEIEAHILQIEERIKQIKAAAQK